MSDNIDPVTGKVREFVKNSVHSESEKIDLTTLIFKEGYFDSMGFIMLITYIEEEFGITTNDAELVEENFESINAIAAYIQRKKNQN